MAEDSGSVSAGEYGSYGVQDVDGVGEKIPRPKRPGDMDPKAKEEAVKIYDNYMKGFPGVKAYQDKQRKYVMQHGFITLNWLTREKAFIYDFDELKKLKENFTQDFWDKYRSIPRNAEGKKVSSDPMEAMMIDDVRKYFKRKSTSEKQAIDYLCQGGA